MEFRTNQGDWSLNFHFILINLQDLWVDGGYNQNHMLRRLFPHMSEHVLKRFHILGGVPNKLIFRETWQVNLYIPAVTSLYNFLVDLIGFLNFIFSLFPDRPDSDDAIADPLHVSQSLLLGFYDRFHFVFGMENIQNAFYG